MTEPEWKKELANCCDKVAEAYEQLNSHINSWENIEGGADPDEILALIQVKIIGLEKKIEAVFESNNGVVQ